MRIKHILAHQAGFAAYPHQALKATILGEDARLNKKLFAANPSMTYSNQLGEHLYAANWLKEFVWDLCMHSALRQKKFGRSYDYQYSCMGFYLMHKLIEKLVEQPMEVFLEDYFYKPLGLHYITYRPLEKFALDHIAPTEACDFFRNTIIQGIVHDPKAAIYGGVAGNAGLFSNAHDLAIVLQMNLQDGYYGGQRYLAKGVVGQFTAQQFKNNRRGLGWDKPAAKLQLSPTSAYASLATYGHLGFTGTAIWVDPQYALIYVFLANRTYPDQSNSQFVRQGIRRQVQDVIYQSLEELATQ